MYCIIPLVGRQRLGEKEGIMRCKYPKTDKRANIKAQDISKGVLDTVGDYICVDLVVRLLVRDKGNRRERALLVWCWIGRWPRER